jgi:hypothetical protein
VIENIRPETGETYQVLGHGIFSQVSLLDAFSEISRCFTGNNQVKE